MSPSLNVLSAGAVTSVGLSLPATGAAIRGAVDCFSETQFLAQGEPILGARVVLQLPDEAKGFILGGIERLARMMGMAVEECLADQDPAQRPFTGLLLVLPGQERLLDLGRLSEACQNACIPHLGTQPAAAYYFSSGAVGGVQALQEARRMLASDPGRVQQVLIAGVDSWLNTPSIQLGLAQNRILTEENSDGFIPGEAAVAILVGPAEGSLQVGGMGMGDEPAPLPSDEPCYGKGLAQAMGSALKEAGLEPHQVSLRLAAISGEEYFFGESAYAWSRLLRHPEPPGKEFMLPATRVGEVGAAAGLLLLAYAWHLAQVGRAPGPHALIELSSPDHLRGAIAATLA